MTSRAGVPAPGRVRFRARVEGVVQGVGFRPFVHRLASELRLDGFVLNDERGVLVEVQGEPARVERFLAGLRDDAPPLATVERVLAESVAPQAAGSGFLIVPSEGRGPPAALVSADVATCEDCLAELFDPADRRFRYPFLNCTNCGPRFTIVRGVPYDRSQTTMAGFAMCAACRAEYEDPADRRFHAQPTACPACGPALGTVPLSGGDSRGRSPLAGAVAGLLAGRVVAVKGLGGYHLACRADDEDAVATLRSRKHREDKPFALMVPTVEAARELVVLGEVEERLLRGRERPIVLAPRREGARVAAAVAPRARELGVMLPYTPLHHLLLADAATPLVMTSGNVSDEPIAYEDADALERLAGIADLCLLHDRPIHMRTDDSVVRAAAGRPLMVRRSRGHVPSGLALPEPAARPVLACGAELKSTFCLARGARAWVSHHIGDLANLETLRSFTEGIEHFERLFDVRPELVAHDLHPEYLSTKYALEREPVAHVAVQHHHAHLAACLAEHGETGPAVGAIFDGTGYGLDGTVWGGELLAGGLGGFERAGHLWPVRLPGGEQAVRQPWRMACAWLQEALGGVPPPLPGIDRKRWEAVAALARGALAAPVTTSMGRLFDAVAALCGIRSEIRYEGQAAIELEAAAAPGDHGRYELPVAAGAEALGAGPPAADLVPAAGVVLDARPTVLAVAEDVARDTPAAVVSARFHDTVAAATAEACARAASARGLDVAVLSGGVFLNRRLLEGTAAALRAAGLRVLVPERLPPGDGGIAYGQAAIAAAATGV
jgi:hydrogenase maturation protein HypF